jgi:hypothetical protein
MRGIYSTKGNQIQVEKTRSERPYEIRNFKTQKWVSMSNRQISKSSGISNRQKVNPENDVIHDAQKVI